jgi:hypothetical protein
MKRKIVTNSVRSAVRDIFVIGARAQTRANPTFTTYEEAGRPDRR